LIRRRHTAAANGIPGDLLGAPAGKTRGAGPLANPSAKDVWMIDPQRKASV